MELQIALIHALAELEALKAEAAQRDSKETAALLTHARKQAKKVTRDEIMKQRMAWRNQIRMLAAEVNELFHEQTIDQKRLKVIQAEVRVRLNPADEVVKPIWDTTAKLPSWTSTDLNAFNNQMAALLKRDWEQAKTEAALRGAEMWVGSGLLNIAGAGDVGEFGSITGTNLLCSRRTRYSWLKLPSFRLWS